MESQERTEGFDSRMALWEQVERVLNSLFRNGSYTGRRLSSWSEYGTQNPEKDHHCVIDATTVFEAVEDAEICPNLSAEEMSAKLRDITSGIRSRYRSRSIIKDKELIQALEMNNYYVLEQGYYDNEEINYMDRRIPSEALESLKATNHRDRRPIEVKKTPDFYINHLSQSDINRQYATVLVSVFPPSHPIPSLKMEKIEKTFEGQNETTNLYKIRVPLTLNFRKMNHCLCLLFGINSRSPRCKVASSRIIFAKRGHPFLPLIGDMVFSSNTTQEGPCFGRQLFSNLPFSMLEKRFRCTLDGVHLILELRDLTTEYAFKFPSEEMKKLVQMMKVPELFDWRECKLFEGSVSRREEPNEYVQERVEYMVMHSIENNFIRRFRIVSQVGELEIPQIFL